MEIIRELGPYKILKLYAIPIDNLNIHSGYGSIFFTIDDLREVNPTCSILEGYCFVDKDYYIPQDAPDWFDTLHEAEDYLIENFG